MLKQLIRFFFVLRECDELKAKVARLQSELYDTECKLRSLSEAHLDLSPSAKEASWVILVGKFHGRDYVAAHPLSSTDFHTIAEEVRRLDKFHRLGRIDGPPEFKANLEWLF